MIRKISWVFILLFCGTASGIFAQDVNLEFGEKELQAPILEQLEQLTIMSQTLLYNDQKYGTEDPYCTSDVKVAPTFSAQVYQQRFADMSCPIDLEYNKTVASFIDLYAVRKRLLAQKLIGLSDLYFPMIEPILHKNEVPMELKYLAMVESALNPSAVSRAGATGLWQFIYSTGKMCDLQITSYVDERMDPYLATEAACKYFKSMYKIYGDWLLVIAAYNCGPGNVNKAIRRSGGKRNIWEIMPYLPRETRGYVPAFVAVTYLMEHQKEHQLNPYAPMFNFFEVDTFRVNYGVSLFEISEMLDVSYDAITYLNPVYKRKYIPATKSKPMILRIPSSKTSEYVAYEQKRKDPEFIKPSFAFNDSEPDKQKVNYRTETIMVEEIYVVDENESLEDVADATGCTVEEIENWNDLKNEPLQDGTQLIVYSKVDYKVAADDILPSSNSTNPKPVVSDGKYLYYYIQKGDTLWDIANNYKGVSVTQLKKYNGITNTRRIKPGMKIKIKPIG